VKTISLKKRIALVAVAALGSSLVASVPANAANNAVGDVVSINLTRVTTTPVVGSAVAVNVGLVTGANSASTEVPLTAVLTKYPSGGFVQTTASVLTGTGSTATANFGYSAGSASASGAVLTLGPAAGARALSAGSVSSSTTVGAGSFSFTPAIAGDYELTVWNDVGTNSSVVDTNESRQTISITVAAAPVASGGASLFTVTSGSGTANGAGSASATSVAPAVRTTGTQVAVAAVAVRGSTGAALNGATVTASVSGSGLVLVNTSSSTAAGTARASSATLTSNLAYVHVSADGSAGKGTVTVTVTDPVTGATSTVGTFDVQFYSSTVATLTATQNYSVLGASRVTGCASTTCTGTTYSTGSAGKPAVLLVAKDSGGNVIPGLTITATSSDLTVIGSSTVVAVDESVNDANGLGYYNASVTGAPTATSGKSATVTYSYTNADLTVIKSAAVPFTIGGTTIVTESLAFDKTSYAPGEAMWITRTAKDSAGNPVADGVASPAITFSRPVGGTAPAAGFYVGGNSRSSTSVATAAVFAPSVGGAFTASMTGGDAAATVRTASSSVTDANAGLLTQIDALNAKIVALNALIAKIMKRLGVK